jgi:hypothetical protein
MHNPWLALIFKTFQLGVEAQSVMALRMMQFASGDAGSRTEFSRMVTEKTAAVVESQGAAAAAVLTGNKDHVVAGKVLNVFRKRVRANKRRLSRR